MESGLDDVGGVFGTEGFAEDILDAGGFEDGADGFAGNDPGARRGGAQENPGTAIMSENLVGDGCILEADAEHLGASEFASFANGIGNFTGLAEADADATALVADNDEGAEIEAAAAFNDLGRAINEDDLLDQFLFLTFEGGVILVRAATPRAEAFAAWRMGMGLSRSWGLGWFGTFDILGFVAVRG